MSEKKHTEAEKRALRAALANFVEAGKAGYLTPAGEDAAKTLVGGIGT
jgi:hypothetical protein